MMVVIVFLIFATLSVANSGQLNSQLSSSSDPNDEWMRDNDLALLINAIHRMHTHTPPQTKVKLIPEPSINQAMVELQSLNQDETRSQDIPILIKKTINLLKDSGKIQSQSPKIETALVFNSNFPRFLAIFTVASEFPSERRNQKLRVLQFKLPLWQFETFGERVNPILDNYSADGFFLWYHDETESMAQHCINVMVALDYDPVKFIRELVQTIVNLKLPSDPVKPFSNTEMSLVELKPQDDPVKSHLGHTGTHVDQLKSFLDYFGKSFPVINNELQKLKRQHLLEPQSDARDHKYYAGVWRQCSKLYATLSDRP